MLASSPQLYHGHEELKRTAEEDFLEVMAVLEALLKTAVLSSTVEAGCFWEAILHSSFSSPFPHFSTCPTFAARINIPWAAEAISSWSGGEDWNSRQENTSSLRQSGPFFLLLFLCGLGMVGYLFLMIWVTTFRHFLHLALRMEMLQWTLGSPAFFYWFPQYLKEA